MMDQATNLDLTRWAYFLISSWHNQVGCKVALVDKVKYKKEEFFSRSCLHLRCERYASLPIASF